MDRTMKAAIFGRIFQTVKPEMFTDLADPVPPQRPSLNRPGSLLPAVDPIEITRYSDSEFGIRVWTKQGPRRFNVKVSEPWS